MTQASTNVTGKSAQPSTNNAAEKAPAPQTKASASKTPVAKITPKQVQSEKSIFESATKKSDPPIAKPEKAKSKFEQASFAIGATAYGLSKQLKARINDPQFMKAYAGRAAMASPVRAVASAITVMSAAKTIMETQQDPHAENATYKTTKNAAIVGGVVAPRISQAAKAVGVSARTAETLGKSDAVASKVIDVAVGATAVELAAQHAKSAPKTED